MWVLDGDIIPSGGICGAIINNDLEKFKSYLNFYIPPDKPFYRDISFSEIFKIAYAFCRFEIVECLIEYGADVNKENYHSYEWKMSEYQTPLTYLCDKRLYAYEYFDDFDAMKPYFETMKILLKYGADVNVKNNVGKTPLMLSCEWIRNVYSCDIKNFEIIKLLLEYGADVNAKDKNGETPLLKFCEGVAGHRVKEVNVFKIVKIITRIWCRSKC